ncbi:MAG: hypothetical protein AB1585_04065 [Thermodesulfobacteriota bacterium]
MVKKNPQETQQAEKAEAYWSRFSPGVEYDDTRSQILSRLAEELDEDSGFQGAFFEKALSLGQTIPLWFFAELSKRVQTKAAQKGIKKTLYLLKQKGVELISPLVPFQGKPAAILRPLDVLPPVGYLTDFDGLRNQMVGLSFSHPVQGRILVFALIGADGLDSFTVFEAGKSRAREIVNDLESQSGQHFWEAEVGHVAYLLKEAHDRNSNLSGEEEEFFSGMMRFFEGKGLVGQIPVIRSIWGEESPEQPLSPDAGILSRIPEVFFLLPEEQTLDAYRGLVTEVRSGLLILNDAQLRDRLRSIVEKAVREIYPREKRDWIRRYLEEAAYLRGLKGQKEEGEILYRWAGTFVPQSKSDSEPENPLLFWLMETILLFEEGEPVQSAEKEEKRSSGGIILPSWVGSGEDRS